MKIGIVDGDLCCLEAGCAGATLLHGEADGEPVEVNSGLLRQVLEAHEYEHYQRSLERYAALHEIRWVSRTNFNFQVACSCGNPLSGHGHMMEVHARVEHERHANAAARALMNMKGELPS